MTRTYTQLSTDDQDMIRTERIKQLEAEHYSNTLAVTSAQATLALVEQAKPTKDEVKEAQRLHVIEQAKATVSAFQENVASLGATLDALTALDAPTAQ